MQQPINVLILGSGGREHAFAWKVSQSARLNALFIAPGNGGTSDFGTNVDLDINDALAISVFVREHHIKLVLIGPEVPLVNGVADYLATSNPQTTVIGPKAAGAQLEGSKAFSKKFMQSHGIPTAAYREFGKDDLAEGLAYLDDHALPIVLKADGLAAGKGVVICGDRASAKSEFELMLSGKFGSAGDTVVVEAFLDGIEFSVFILTDGQSYQTLPIAKDYKRIGEADSGLNTGGMGSISPVPFVDEKLMSKVTSQIIDPTIAGLKADRIPYQGFIFFGLISVGGEPFVIEYNCRMGDPETQSVLLRLKSDFVELCLACGSGDLATQQIEKDARTVASIVLVSGGYPGSYEKGKQITGIHTSPDQLVFHAGTKLEGDELLTNGGRVLAVSSLANNLKEALARSNAAASQIKFDGAYHRRDIGFDLIEK